MKQVVLLATLLLLIMIQLFAVGQETAAEDESMTYYGFDAGFSNRYMWRGISYNNGLVFQPDVYIGYGDFCFTMWSNLTIWDVDSQTSNELDFTLSYYKTLFNIDVDASLNYYHYFGASEYNTAEGLLNLSYPIGNFSIFNNFSLDVLEYSGAVFNETGFSYERELAERFSVDGTILAGLASKKFNEGYLEVSKNAFNYLGLGAKLTYCLKNDLCIDAHFQWNQFMDRDIADVLGVNSSYFELIFRKEF